MNEKNQSLSVIIPVYNEEESLPSFAEELIAAVSKIPMPSEIIFVDDGSSDQSQAVIRKIAATDSRVKGVFLGRNAGQTSALSAGIQKSSGTLIASLDADGQNDPKDLERLISKLNEGYDVVSGWRKNRKDSWLNRRLPSQIANALISRVTGVYLHDYGCSLKIYKSEYLKPIRLYGEMHRFVPAFAGFLGAKITELEVNHRPRIKGKSKYGISRTLKVILDLLTVKFMDLLYGKTHLSFRRRRNHHDATGSARGGNHPLQKIRSGDIRQRSASLSGSDFFLFDWFSASAFGTLGRDFGPHLF